MTPPMHCTRKNIWEGILSACARSCAHDASLISAAVMARYFEHQSKDLGDAFRIYIFQHQPEIFPGNLRSFADRFAAEHKTALPFVVDPKGDLAAAVTADRDLGKRVGIDHTPTVYVVTSKTSGTPFVEVKKPQEELFQTIDALKR